MINFNVIINVIDISILFIFAFIFLKHLFIEFFKEILKDYLNALLMYLARIHMENINLSLISNFVYFILIFEYFFQNSCLILRLGVYVY